MRANSGSSQFAVPAPCPHPIPVFRRLLAPASPAVTFLLLLALAAALRADELDLKDPKDAVLNFMMLPAEEKPGLLKEIARNGDLRAGDFFAEVLASEDKDVVKDETVMEEHVIPLLSVLAEPKHLPLARKAGQSEDAHCRRYGAILLGYTGAPEAAEDLKRLLQSQDDFVRRNAIRGLGSLGARQAADVLDTFASSSKFQEEKDQAVKARDRIRANLERPKGLPAPYPPDFSTVTPHVEWAKPLAKKPKVLFLLERAVLRDFIEVCQRLDVDWDYVDIGCRLVGKGRGDLHLLEIRDDIRSVVLDRLDKDWDAIAVWSILGPGRMPAGNTVKDSRGPIGWSSFPEEVQRAMLRKVGQGTGLLLVDDGPDKIGGKAAELPGLAGFHPWPREAKAETFGKGRILRCKRGVEAQTWLSVILDIRRLVPMGDGFQVPAIPGKTRQVYPSEDFCFAALARAILWLSGHDFPVRVAEAALSARQGQTGTVTVRAEGDIPGGAKAWVELADPCNRSLTAQTFPMTSKQVSSPLPPLPAGNVVVRTKLLDSDGRVISWAAFFSQVAGDCGIKEVVPPPLPLSPAKPLTAEVRLQGNPPGGAKLVGQAIDSWSRLVGRAQATAKGAGNVSLTFDNGRLLSLAVSLDISLEGPAGEPLSFVRQPVVIRHERDFKDVAWINWGADGYLDMWRKLRPDFVSNLSLETLEAGIEPSTPGFSGPVPNHDSGTYSPDGIRRPCLTSAKWDMQLENAVRKNIEEYVALNCRLFLLSDETGLGGEYCWSQSCLSGFRDYLRTEYGTLHALNKIWNTNYADWQDIMPSRLKELKDADHPGPWFDHRVFMDLVYTGMYDRVQTLVRSRIPDARAGSSTTETEDQWVFARRQGIAALFVSIRYRHEEMSFRPDDQFLGGWFRPGYDYGYLRNETGTWFWGWDQILHGASVIITWIGEYGFDYPMARGDLAPDRILLNTRAMADDIRSGYGRLFLGAKRRAGDYAMYYSPRSNLAARAISQSGRPWEQKRCRTFMPCYEADMAFRFPRIVAYAEVLMGYLRETPPKVLYLPLVRCLSLPEIEEIKRYVGEGGVLLACADTGLRDEHGVPYDKWPLEELFGLKRKPGADPVASKWGESAVEVTGPVEGIDLTDLKLRLLPGAKPAEKPPVLVGEDVEPTQAKPIFRVGGLPAGFVNRYGKGLAIYFNLDPGELALPDQSEETPTAHQVLLERIFAALGIRRGYEVEWQTGRPIVASRPGYTLAEFADGTGRYLGFHRVGEGDLKDQPLEKVKLTLDEAAFAYDARRSQFLGQGKLVEFQFPRGIPAIISLMPYRVQTVAVEAATAAPGGTATVRAKVTAEGRPAGRHVLAVRVYRPDGEEALCFRRNLDTADVTAQYALPLAWNDPEGAWRVTVRDVATGVAGEAVLTVKK
jgi:hypothetical protein